MQACGATEQEKSQAISMLKAGATMAQVKAAFNEIEADYFDRNEAELLEAAGKTPKKKDEKKPDPLA